MGQICLPFGHAKAKKLLALGVLPQTLGPAGEKASDLHIGRAPRSPYSCRNEPASKILDPPDYMTKNTAKGRLNNHHHHHHQYF